MGLTTVVYDPDLEYRVVTQVDEILNTSGEPDPVLVIGDIAYEEHRKPKRELPEQLKIFYRKAQQARANIAKSNKHHSEKGEPTIKYYSIETLALFFFLSPITETKQIVGILEEQQRRNLALSGQSPQDNYIKAKY